MPGTGQFLGDTTLRPVTRGGLRHHGPSQTWFRASGVAADAGQSRRAGVVAHLKDLEAWDARQRAIAGEIDAAPTAQRRGELQRVRRPDREERAEVSGAPEQPAVEINESNPPALREQGLVPRDDRQEAGMLLDEVDEDDGVQPDRAAAEVGDQSHDRRSMSTWEAASAPFQSSLPRPRSSRMECESASSTWTLNR